MTLYTLVDIAATFSECALTVYFIDHIPVLESSERNKIRSLLCICIVFAFSLLADYFDKSGTVSGILGLLLTVLYCVFTKIGNCLVKAVFPILNMLAVLFINTAVISFFAYKNEVPVLDLIAFETDERIAILIVTKILYFVFIFISLKLLNIMQQKLFYIKV